ncbi:MAG TPA: class I SAM-dependent methyltransferase, partial [Elainellaceae cyanobacterium]
NYQVAIAVRTKLIDDIVKNHIAARSNALVVELGSGLSSRYYRVASEGITWIELDLPQVIQLRRQLDAETEKHQFLAGSVLEPTWMNYLPNAASEDIIFIAEGLFYYFSEAEVKQVLQLLRRNFPGSSLVLDVATVRAKNRKALEKASQLGAPMKWFVRNSQDLNAMGLSLIDVLPMLQAYPNRWRYFRWLSWIPSIRNANLIIHSRLASWNSP